MLPAVDDQSGATVALRPLHDDDAAAMRDLVRLTEPGPFKSRRIDAAAYATYRRLGFEVRTKVASGIYRIPRN